MFIRFIIFYSILFVDLRDARPAPIKVRVKSGWLKSFVKQSLPNVILGTHKLTIPKGLSTKVFREPTLPYICREFPPGTGTIPKSMAGRVPHIREEYIPSAPAKRAPRGKLSTLGAPDQDPDPDILTDSAKL